jgi:hypothetical protein
LRKLRTRQARRHSLAKARGEQARTSRRRRARPDIFAAPQPYDGFSKYYFIFRSKGKINLNDKQHAVRREDLKISEN